MEKIAVADAFVETVVVSHKMVVKSNDTNRGRCGVIFEKKNT